MGNFRVIISGGGTGGHIFPAISIANSIRELIPDAEILFVGASGKMEMEKVPAAGYEIKGIPAKGLKRPLYSLSNIKVAFDYLRCKGMARQIIKKFNPDIVVGVGGYASAAIVGAAGEMKIPIVLQEQNSFAGIVNRKNARWAKRICVAYDNMERFFPKEKIILTGNPIRKEIVRCNGQMKEEGIRHYNLSGRKVLFVVGGSLGCQTLNESVKQAILSNKVEGYDVIWQCGKIYKESAETFLREHPCKGVYCTDFITRMDLAYAAADVVVSRAGAGTISELCVAGKATIFVPSPNVSEDHQTHNAMSLVSKDAALMVKDSEAQEKLFDTANALMADDEKIKKLENNIHLLARSTAGEDIAKICIVCAGKGEGEGIVKSNRDYDNIYFIGIGGIGMSAIARYYNKKGYNVSGYDKTPTQLTRELESEGIKIHYTDDVAQIPCDKENTLVIYTPAIPSDMEELLKVQQDGYEVVKRSAALGKIAMGQRCLAVSGSHGKTTTSTLLAHIYNDSEVGCSAFLGGISKNYNTNLIISSTPNLVAEADEFDRSFLQLYPHSAVVTATDPDHLDIYGTVENMRAAYSQFISQAEEEGYVVIKSGTKIDTSATKAKILYYSFTKESASGEEPQFYASDIKPISADGKKNGLFEFTLHYPSLLIGGSGEISNCVVGIPGWVNIENAVAASAIALLEGIEPDKVRHALATFKGVKRRMDVHVNNPKNVYIDDYAHHPEEIATTLSSIREAFPERKITAIFQPHLYTRTRDLADEFAQSLSGADSLILLDIYPARELPIEGVTSEIIFDKVTLKDKISITKEELMDLLAKRREDIELLVTFGAGNIDRFIEPITELFANE